MAGETHERMLGPIATEFRQFIASRRVLSEALLPFLFQYLRHPREKLSEAEEAVLRTFEVSLAIKERKTKGALIVGMVGLVGSGKSTVARMLGEKIDATVIKADSLRVALRNQNLRYDNVQTIIERAIVGIISKGGNTIIDSDFADPIKRASLIARSRSVGARVVFVRTHCDYDVAAGRFLENYLNGEGEEFFTGASSAYQGNGRLRGGIVKLREMNRRMPHHYQRQIDLLGRTGGVYTLRPLGIPFIASIDTGDSEEVKRLVGEYGEKIMNDF